MNRQSIRKPFVLLGCIVLLWSMQALGSTNREQQRHIKVAAEESLSLLLNMIPIGQEVFYGFSDRDAFAKANISLVIQVFTINQMSNDEHILPVKPSGEWMALVQVEDFPACIVTIAEIDNKWQAVAIGARDLAREIYYHPLLANNNRPAPIGLLRIFPLQCDLLIQEQQTHPVGWRASPLISASMALALTYNKSVSYALTDLLPEIERRIGIVEIEKS